MQIETAKLFQELLEKTEEAIATVQSFKSLSSEQLNHKASQQQWSILECIEHLNLYGDFYLPEIEQRIMTSSHKVPKLIFKSGWLGNYFANMLLPKNGKIVKMQSPKDKNPQNSTLNINTLDRFLKQLAQLKQLLVQAESVDLMRTKTGISISKLIKLRLGDTFRVVVYHNERHIIQAKRVINNFS